MAVHHRPSVFESLEMDSVDDINTDSEYESDIAALLSGVEYDGPTGEDAHLEEQFEDMVSGTMFDSMDD